MLNSSILYYHTLAISNLNIITNSAITYLLLFSPEYVEVCTGELMKIQCPEDHVILATSALFGRMEITRCIDVKEFIGCRNDVLFLIDKWCSGRRQCEVFIPNTELKAANEECLRYLQMYINVEYSCLQGLSCKCLFKHVLLLCS